MERWKSISQLRGGSERQQQAFHTLVELDIFTVLSDFEPVLAGTIPLGIDTPASDLDIICCADDLEQLRDTLEFHYGHYDEFTLELKTKYDLPALVCHFLYAQFSIEIYAQPIPSDEQRAFKHLVAEGRLLQMAGPDARQAIHQLKLDGLKTEPAFATYFQLEGDPYVALSDLADSTVDEMAELIQRAQRIRYGHQLGGDG